MYIMVAVFALIGMSRGWAKEMLVTFSVILMLFIINVLERFVPFLRDNGADLPGNIYFWVRAGLLIALVFFGYQSPNMPRLAATNRFARDRLQDWLLGFFLGAINGYLIVGTLWFYMDTAGYPFDAIVNPANTQYAEETARIIATLPPQWLGTPAIYFAVAIAFAFVLVVFV
jgi:uncharacterized membrane protein required for colicin V production